MVQVLKDHRNGTFQSNETERSIGEFHFLLNGRMGSMIRGDCIHRPIHDAGHQCLDVSTGAQRG